MSHLDFILCLSDPYFWMRPANKAYILNYYWQILVYTDYFLVISSNSEHVLRGELGKYFELKEESIGPPNIYLGGNVRKV